jgi:hypothetical protein
MSETRAMRYGTSGYTGSGTGGGRTLHLLDIENLVGDPCADDASVMTAVEAYKEAAGVGPHDLAVMASNGRLAMAAGLAWPGALLRVGRGPDGADLALLAEAVPEVVAPRFSRVVVGSGDGIFADLARQLGLLGNRVVVVARGGGIAARLRAVAEVRLLVTAQLEPSIADVEVAA